MGKGLPQVAKSASKVAKKGPRWTQFGPGGLTFEASRAFLVYPGAFLRTFFSFFCIFVQNL